MLTLEEAKAFKTKKEPDATDEKRKPGSGNSTNYIYKTVGKYELKLFVYTPKEHKADAKVPAIVFFHASGFKGGSESAFEPQSTYLAALRRAAVPRAAISRPPPCWLTTSAPRPTLHA